MKVKIKKRSAYISECRQWGNPFYLQLHITDKCNLRCKHCYEGFSNAKASSLLKPNEIYALLDEYHDFLLNLNVRGKIYFTGGEPILDPHLCDYISRAANLGLCTMVLSNGTLIDYSKALELSKAGTRVVQVSIEGLEDTHDYIRGKNSFQKALKGLDNCVEVGMRTVVMTTLSRFNMSEIDGVIKECIQHGVTSFSLGRLVPTGSGANLAEQVLTKKELFEVFETIKHLRVKYRDLIYISIHDPLWLMFLGLKNTHGCSAGIRGICIIENGDIMPCRRLNTVIGNIRNNSLIEIWNSPILTHFCYRDNYEGKCKNCKYLKRCGGCRAIAKSLSGSEFGEDPQCFF